MNNMGKKIGELHALLIESEKGLPKKAATQHVMAIQGGRIQKANKKSLNAKDKGKRKGKGKDKSYILKPKNPKPYAKEHSTKDDACHHCKEVVKKKEKERIKVISLSQKNPKPSAKEHPTKDDTCHHYKEVGNCKRNYPTYLVGLIKKKKQVGTDSSSDIFVIELFYFPTKSYLKKTMGYYFNFPPKNKIVIARYAEFFEKNLLSQEVSGKAGELEEIQDKDTSPSKITRKFL
ncbi:hypothetical protein Tco_0008449 [Tanacetum coccineum]